MENARKSNIPNQVANASYHSDYANGILTELATVENQIIEICNNSHLSESKKLDALRKLLTESSLLKLSDNTGKNKDLGDAQAFLQTIFSKLESNAEVTDITPQELSKFIKEIATEGKFKRAECKALLLLDKLTESLKIQDSDKIYKKLLKGITLGLLAIIAAPFMAAATAIGTLSMSVLLIGATLSTLSAIIIIVVFLTLSLLSPAIIVVPGSAVILLSPLVKLREQFSKSQLTKLP